MKKLILLGIVTLLVVTGLMVTVQSLAGGKQESANGHGTLNNPDGTKRQFSFNAQRRADGTVTGNAVLHNPAFPGGNGNAYQATFDISCMKVIGNTAILGGYVRRTNDPNLVSAAYFEVQDNGEPGKDRDAISGVVFYDTTPNQGSPALCQVLLPGGLGDLQTIDGGNIQVKQ